MRKPTGPIQHSAGVGNVRLYGALADDHGAIPGWHASSVAGLVAALRHVPGDTTTPPAPGAIQIGPVDVS
ncbi:hypothetical protein [Achromobacter marplatensis]|uniref:hypothetical protein n=1 Tax=Achromobacter marplatensis TaxID=470868 RepID=UPI00103F5D03|nr:hypothetical protein [Achromobacter marplatensis]